ncbi:GNAT family N-acetyltransferase [Sphaerisporangium fuscum]|uniref:GNAT family N-acetyltransferase n=1 Tax=Sphaerisporangium fuscum TaxID=2835868 RepID=UPI001BDC7871|nr:GNAT family N-acetyltransferase [Sphaerisporangium fuscum]
MLLIREMQEPDIEPVSAVRIAGWKTAYRGMVPQTYLDGLSVEDDARARREWFRRNDGTVLNLVAEVDGTVRGWLAMGPNRDDDAEPGTGEIYALYVRPELIGTGIGRALVEAALEAASERRFHRLVLWVLEANHRARRFYASAGFTPDGTGKPWEVEGTPVPELRYHRPLVRHPASHQGPHHDG